MDSHRKPKTTTRIVAITVVSGFITIAFKIQENIITENHRLLLFNIQGAVSVYLYS